MRERRSPRPHRAGISPAALVRLALAFALVAFVAPLATTADAQSRRGSTDRQAANPSEDRPGTPMERLQPLTLPALPAGMMLDDIREGDRLFHGRGGCFACHGTEGEGLPAAGDAITISLAYAMPSWESIDSLVTHGLPDALTRSPIAMPARGARGDLTDEEIRRVAAYVWAISQVRGEPWPGGHPTHAGMVPPGSTRGTAQTKPWQLKRP